MNRHPRIDCAALLAACVFAAGQAAAPGAEGTASWVGKPIITKKPGVKLLPAADGGEQKPLATLTDLIYPVDEVKGDFLKVRHRGLTGWVAKKDVVLLDDAVAFFSAELRQDGKNAHARGSRGLARGAQGDSDRAIEDLGEAIRLEPTNPAWYMLRASAWEHRQRPDKALADLDLVLRLDPTDAVAYYNRGNLRSARHEYDKALADFGEAVRLEPQFVQAWCNRGIAWAAKKEFDKALADLDHSIRLNPQLAHGFYNRALVLMEQKDYEKALTDLDQALSLEPQYAPAFACRGLIRTARREYDKALAEYDEAVRLAPTDPRALAARGSVRLLRKDYAKALADFDRATRIDPKDAGALNSLAWLLATCPEAKVRDGPRAVELARRACGLTDSKNPYCLGTLAAACAEFGDFDQAVKNQRLALEDVAYAKAEGEKARRRLGLYQTGKPYREE